VDVEKRSVQIIRDLIFIRTEVVVHLVLKMEEAQNPREGQTLSCSFLQSKAHTQHPNWLRTHFPNLSPKAFFATQINNEFPLKCRVGGHSLVVFYRVSTFEYRFQFTHPDPDGNFYPHKILFVDSGLLYCDGRTPRLCRHTNNGGLGEPIPGVLLEMVLAGPSLQTAPVNQITAALPDQLPKAPPELRILTAKSALPDETDLRNDAFVKYKLLVPVFRAPLWPESTPPN
jgi:hypothetical protein